MATIEQRNQRFRVIFYFAGRRFTASLATTNRGEADAVAGSVERTLMLLTQGVLSVPQGADFLAFVLSGGKQHFITTLGAHHPIQTLELSHLQQHIERRAKQKGHFKRPLSPVTLRKEVAGFRAEGGPRADYAFIRHGPAAPHDPGPVPFLPL